jgi:putative spermidine/putrescine transport system substrate-binding protein
MSDFDTRSELTRRALIAGLGASALVGSAGGAPAQSGGELTVANWGGDWNDRTVKFIEAPLLESKGVRILRDLSGEPERKTKLLAERNLPRSTIDVSHVGDYMSFELRTQGVWDDIDYSKVPNAATVVENLRSPYFLPWQYSAWVILYNPTKITEKPTSFADLWNPKYAGKVGINNQHYHHNLQIAGLVNGGSMTNFDKIKQSAVDWKKAVQPKIVPTHQQLAAAFKSEEIWIAGNYRARGMQFASEGIPVETANPKEGGIAVIFGACIPKKTRNKAMAHTYLNALLDPKGLGDLVQASFYTPSITNAQVPQGFLQKIAFEPADQAKLQFQDFDYMAKNSTTWLEYWDKEFRA